VTDALLVLFDVDCTLLLTHDEVYVDANRAALAEVWGVSPDGADVPGDTALAQTRRALRMIGIDDAEIDAGLPAWCASLSRRYVELLRDADTSSWELAPGAKEALPLITRRALLTGNPEAVARARIERLGLAALFAGGGGAFGCEREQRVDLFALARERAGDWPADRTVAVGDTPLDVAGARAAGARCIAVATGACGAHELAAADVVIASLAELPAALERLAA
jgi:phosphoglycolate phosphatase